MLRELSGIYALKKYLIPVTKLNKKIIIIIIEKSFNKI